MTGARILQKSTVENMFTNQIPQFPNFGRKSLPSVKSDLVNSMSELFPQPHDQEQGWGLTFMITPHRGPTGRSANTAHWAGLPNLWWWCDREKGIAGMVSDAKVNELIGAVESTVYRYYV